jgi:transcriptional regulator with XRE-family HTH domain
MTSFDRKLGVSPNTVARWERNEVPIRESMALLVRLLAKNEGKKG